MHSYASLFSSKQCRKWVIEIMTERIPSYFEDIAKGLM